MTMTDVRLPSTACRLSGLCFGSFIGFFVAATEWDGYVACAFITPSHQSSHTQHMQNRFWVLRIHFFLCLACLPFVLTLPETHGPTILTRRARALRQKGHIHSFSQEELEPATPRHIVQSHLLRPASELLLESDNIPRADAIIEMLIYEPLCQGAAVWIGLAYGII
jgi:hypothetical protein